MKTLYCDPSQNNTITLRFGDCPGNCLREVTLPQPYGEQVLKMITDLIGSDQVEQIVLVNQAQSFTLIRVLATICNSLAYSLPAQLHSVDHAVHWDQLSQVLSQAVPQIVPRYSAPPKISGQTSL